MTSSLLRSGLACSLALALGAPLPASAYPMVSGAALKDPPAAVPTPPETEVPPPEAEVTPPEAEPAPSGAEPAAASAGGGPRQGRIFIDASGLGDAGPVLAGQATRAASDMFGRSNVANTDAPAGPELRVVLTLLPDDQGYRAEYQIIYDGEPIDNGTGSSDCQLCTDDELIDRVVAIAEQVAPLMVVPEEPEPEVVPEVEADTGEPTDTDTDTGEQPGRGRLGPVGGAGIGLLAAGAASMIGGIVFVVREPAPWRDGSERASELLNTRPLGGALLGGGGVAVILGATFLAIAIKQRSGAEESVPDKRSALRLHPLWGRGTAGVGVRGRF